MEGVGHFIEADAGHCCCRLFKVRKLIKYDLNGDEVGSRTILPSYLYSIFGNILALFTLALLAIINQAYKKYAL